MVEVDWIDLMMKKILLFWLFMSHFIYAAELPIEISAKDLYSEYDRNGFLASEKYLGKVVLITGKVIRIFDNYFIRIGADWGNVGATLQKSQREELLKMRVDDSIRLLCFVSGTDENNNPMLNECKVY